MLKNYTFKRRQCCSVGGSLVLLSFRNLGEGESGKESFRPVSEPATSTQRCPEALQMDIIGEWTGTKCFAFTVTAVSIVVSIDL